jgi:hypothetical protein
LAALRDVAREDKAAFLPGFFQAVPGGYGEGDRFLGCVVPDQRKVASSFVTCRVMTWQSCLLRSGMSVG